jgi:hypothetical protein
MRTACLWIVISSSLWSQNRTDYTETFNQGPGGWTANRYHPLPLFDGVAHLFGPWYLDSHHAPGAGYPLLNQRSESSS